MSEFTKGEWVTSASEEYPSEVEVNCDGWNICLVHDDADGVPSHVNARLIAAAPELYSALESTSRELEWCIDYINNHMRKNISASDFQPPDYYDHQTCHENQVLLEKIKSEM